MSQKCPSCDYPYVPNSNGNGFSDVICPNCGGKITHPVANIFYGIVGIIIITVILGTCFGSNKESSNKRQMTSYEAQLWERWENSHNSNDFTKDELKTIWNISYSRNQKK